MEYEDKYPIEVLCRYSQPALRQRIVRWRKDPDFPLDDAINIYYANLKLTGEQDIVEEFLALWKDMFPGEELSDAHAMLIMATFDRIDFAVSKVFADAFGLDNPAAVAYVLSPWRDFALENQEPPPAPITWAEFMEKYTAAEQGDIE